MQRWIRAAVVTVSLGLATSAFAQQVTKQVVPGVTNFAKLDTTIACAGATTPAGGTITTALPNVTTQCFSFTFDHKDLTAPTAGRRGSRVASLFTFLFISFSIAAVGTTPPPAGRSGGDLAPPSSTF